MPIYQREHRASLYSSHAYYIARSVAELPTQIIWPFLFVTIVSANTHTRTHTHTHTHTYTRRVARTQQTHLAFSVEARHISSTVRVSRRVIGVSYWMIGLNDNGSRYIEFALGLILTSNAAMSLGYALAIGAPSVQVALAMGMPIILPFILFGGLFINIDSIPKYFYWSAAAPHSAAPCPALRLCS